MGYIVVTQAGHTTKGYEMARRFGIEVEFKGSRDRVVAELAAAGLSGRHSQVNYTYSPESEWVVKADASVTRGGELVGPPLDFDDPEQRAQVNTAIACLVRAGASTDPAAGIHVHIDGTDLDAKQVGAIGRFWVKYEDSIYRMASSGWNTIRPNALNNYAKLLDVQRAKKLMKANTKEALKEAWYGENNFYTNPNPEQVHGHSSRYCGLNLHSWFYRGTIEFRVFNSSLNADRVQCYIAMSMAIVQYARQGFRASISTATSIGSMAEDPTIEKKEWSGFLASLRYKGGMHLDDLALMRRFWKDSKPQRAAVAYRY
jgi:hypothetical protein